MSAFWVIHYVYKCKCDICELTDNPTMVEQGSQQVPVGGTIPNHSLPPGWHQVDDQLVCPDHILSITKYTRVGDNKPLKREMHPWDRT